MPRNVTPVSDIDWARLFCLPVGVPPSGITPNERVQYARNLSIAAEIPLGTHGRYFGDPPMLDIRVAGPASPKPILPRHGRTLVPTVPQALGAGNINTLLKLLGKAAYNPAPPAPGDVAAVDTELQEKVPIDPRALRFAPFPIPRLGLDSVEIFFAQTAKPWLPATLVINDAGALDDHDSPTAPCHHSCWPRRRRRWVSSIDCCSARPSPGAIDSIRTTSMPNGGERSGGRGTQRDRQTPCRAARIEHGAHRGEEQPHAAVRNSHLRIRSC